MGNIYRKLLGTSNTDFAESVRSALVEKFGDEVTIHNSSTDIVFSCPRLSNKVIRLSWGGGWYGSAHSSGVNITDSVQFQDIGSGTTDGHMVLGDNFLFISGNGGNRSNVIIAKTEGGKYIISGSTSRNNLHTVNITKDLTNNKKFEFVEFHNTVMCDINTPYKSKLLMNYIDETGQSLMMKDDGTTDTIKDLYMSTYYNPSNFMHIVTPNALLSSREVWSNQSNKYVFHSSVVAEF